MGEQMIEKLRNRLAKAIADFAIEYIAAPEYSRNLKVTIILGELTWRKEVEKELAKIKEEDS